MHIKIDYYEEYVVNLIRSGYDLERITPDKDSFDIELSKTFGNERVGVSIFVNTCEGLSFGNVYTRRINEK